MAPSEASPGTGLRRRSRRSNAASFFDAGAGDTTPTPRTPRRGSARRGGSQALEEPLRGDRVRPGVEDEVIVGEHEHTHDHEQHAGAALHDGNEGSVALEEPQEGPQRQRRQQEGQAQSRGVGDEQADAAPDRLRRAGERQDRAEDRPHARRPAHGERHADDERADVACRLFPDLQRRRPPEEADPQHTGDVEAKEDDEHAAQAPDPVAIREQQLAGRAERGAERDEHQREPEDEGDRVQQHAPPRVRAEVGGEIADGHAGDERDVGRKQRQHAGRQEREESRAERDGHAERGAHQRSIAWTRPWAAESSQERGPSATPAIRPCRSITKLEGSARTPYFSATAILGSSATGKLNLRALTNGGTFLGSASSEIATSTNPASLWRRQRRSMAGISSRHGGHHVAQKFTSTTLPRCSESLKLRPSGMGSAKSSATFGLLGLMRSRCLSARSTLGPAAGAAGAGGGSGWALGRAATGAAGSGVGAMAAAYSATPMAARTRTIAKTNGVFRGIEILASIPL